MVAAYSIFRSPLPNEAKGESRSDNTQTTKYPAFAASNARKAPVENGSTIAMAPLSIRAKSSEFGLVSI